MRYAVDADEVTGLGALATDVAHALSTVDLGGLEAAVREAMPGSDSARCLRVVDDLQVGLGALLTALAAEGNRLRLAAQQYAAADRVVAAAGHRAAGASDDHAVEAFDSGAAGAAEGSALGPFATPPVGAPGR